ncbi:MAG: DUF2975 domain-containing protein [Oscillospiraceae bacterium]|nr:DUF2975 domain-containing protein [Oscillospiraceae bacterium]
MKTQAISKINKVGKAGYIVALIFKILAIVVASLLVFLMIITAFIPKGFMVARISERAELVYDLSKYNISLSPDDIDSLNNWSDMLGDNFMISSGGKKVEMLDIKASETQITMRGEGDVYYMDLHSVSYMLIPLLISLISTIVCLAFATRLCRAFQLCETPFDDIIIRRLRQLAYSLIPLAVLSSLADGTTRSLFAGQMHLSFNINVGMVIAVLLIFLLVSVFKYGAELQRESDETL